MSISGVRLFFFVYFNKMVGSQWPKMAHFRASYCTERTNGPSAAGLQSKSSPRQPRLRG